MTVRRIVTRVQIGKPIPSKEKQEIVDIEMAFHLSFLKRGIESREFVQDYVYNADETHFVVYLNDGRTLAMEGDESVKYSDVVCSDQGMTMIVMLGGG